MNKMNISKGIIQVIVAIAIVLSWALFFKVSSDLLSASEEKVQAPKSDLVYTINCFESKGDRIFHGKGKIVSEQPLVVETYSGLVELVNLSCILYSNKPE